MAPLCQRDRFLEFHQYYAIWAILQAFLCRWISRILQRWMSLRPTSPSWEILPNLVMMSRKKSVGLLSVGVRQLLKETTFWILALSSPHLNLGGSTFSRAQTEMMLLGVALCRLFFMTFMCSLRFPHHMTKYLIIWEGGDLVRKSKVILFKINGFTLCGTQAVVVGDPHIKTLDGRHYIMMSQGTFSIWRYHGLQHPRCQVCMSLQEATMVCSGFTTWKIRTEKVGPGEVSESSPFAEFRNQCINQTPFQSAAFWKGTRAWKPMFRNFKANPRQASMWLGAVGLTIQLTNHGWGISRAIPHNKPPLGRVYDVVFPTNFKWTYFLSQTNWLQRSHWARTE